MALTLHALKLLAPFMRGASVLCLGYPDILATPEEASAAIGESVSAVSKFGASHKRSAPMVDTEAVLNALGADADFYDAMPSRGIEQELDLNEPREWIRTFDLVIDAGTIEHCANIGQALMNAAHAVSRGGEIFHSPPLSMVNHGFYNVSPTLLVDFYEQNGWDVLHLSGFSAHAPYELIKVDARDRFIAPPNCALYFMAQRGSRAAKELHWPIQGKYLNRAKAA